MGGAARDFFSRQPPRRRLDPPPAAEFIGISAVSGVDPRLYPCLDRLQMSTDGAGIEGLRDVPGGVTRKGKLRFLTLEDLDRRTTSFRETVRIIEEIEA